MPKASELQAEPHLRVLVLGDPKVGKSVMAIGSSPTPLRVFLCEDDSALLPARRVVKEDFVFRRTLSFDTMQNETFKAHKLARQGKIKTLIVDTLSAFGSIVEQECLAEATHGQAAYGKYNRNLIHIVGQWLRIPCHVVVLSHYEVRKDKSGEEDEDAGVGKVPLLAGKAAAKIAAMFPDIVWFDYNEGRRILVTGPTGAWGPGCRHSSETKKLPADVLSGKKLVGIKRLIKHFGLTPSAAAPSASE